MNEEQGPEFPYVLVEFIYPNGKNCDVKDIEGLPISWVIRIDEICYAFYPRPPYSEETLAELRAKIKKQAMYCIDWALYQVDIKGKAETYKEMLLKVEILKNKIHAFSDSDAKEETRKSIVDSLHKSEDILVLDFETGLPSSCIGQRRNSESSEEEICRDDDIGRNKLYKHNNINRKKKMLQQNNAQTKKKKTLVKEVCAGINSMPNEEEVISERMQKSLAYNSPNMVGKGKALFQNNALLQNKPIKDIRKSTYNEIAGSDEIDIMKQLNSISEASTSNQKTILEGVESVISTVKCAAKDASKITDYELLLKGVYTIVNMVMKPIQEDIKALRQSLCHQMHQVDSETITQYIHNFDTMKKKYSLTMPIEDTIDFDILETILDTEEGLKDFNCALRSEYRESSSLSKNINHLLQAIYTREMVMRYTFSRHTDEKFVFKCTKLYMHLFNFLVNAYRTEGRTLDVNKYNTALKTVLPNAKDWYGNRKKKTD